MRKVAKIGWLFLIFAQVCFGQKFKYKAELSTPEEDGFHKVDLNPEIQNSLNDNFSDIRLYDWKNREVPYLLEKAKPVQARKYFREYAIIQKDIIPKKQTTLVIQNRAKSKINNISLVIKNTNVPKEASLSGSSDGQNWYGLDTYFRLQTVSEFSETSEVKMLSFPLSDYEFYRLEINDSSSAPLNILAAGFYNFAAKKGKYTQVPNLNFKQTDSTEQKQTYLTFKFPKPVRLDNLEFEIDSPAFYLRNANVLIPQERYSRRNKKYTELVSIATFQLSSESKNNLDIPNFKAREFYVVINNEDNPPLKIQQIKGCQLNAYLVASVKEGKEYELRFGDENVGLPTYDLVNFRNKIPAELPVLEPKEIKIITKADTEESKVNTYLKDKTIIWVVLVLVLTLLGYMTAQMLKENGRN